MTTTRVASLGDGGGSQMPLPIGNSREQRSQLRSTVSQHGCVGKEGNSVEDELLCGK